MIIKKTIAFDLQTRLIEQINIMRESQEYRFEDIEMIVSSLIKKFPDEKFLTEKDLIFNDKILFKTDLIEKCISNEKIELANNIINLLNDEIKKIVQLAKIVEYKISKKEDIDNYIRIIRNIEKNIVYQEDQRMSSSIDEYQRPSIKRSSLNLYSLRKNLTQVYSRISSALLEKNMVYKAAEICFLIPDNSYKFPCLLEIQNKLERSVDNYNDSIRHQVHDEIRKIMGSSETFKPFSPIL